jgi:hypothetical protein
VWLAETADARALLRSAVVVRKVVVVPTKVNQEAVERLAGEVLTRHNLTVLDELFHADYIEADPPPGMGPGVDGRAQGNFSLSRHAPAEITVNTGGMYDPRRPRRPDAP